MPAATMTSKGQITIPKEIRDDLGLEAGSKILFVRLGDGQYRILPRTGDIMALAGLLHEPSRPTLTLDEMDEAVAEGWVESGLHGSPGHDYDEPL